MSSLISHNILDIPTPSEKVENDMFNHGFVFKDYYVTLDDEYSQYYIPDGWKLEITKDNEYRLYNPKNVLKFIFY